MKKTLILTLFIHSVISNAQQGPFGYYRDALIFSQSNTAFGSTARIQAIGGAQVALGGDLSSISSNPAGLGFFNRVSLLSLHHWILSPQILNSGSPTKISPVLLKSLLKTI